jgi:hypothetical protein
MTRAAIISGNRGDRGDRRAFSHLAVFGPVIALASPEAVAVVRRGLPQLVQGGCSRTGDS